MKFTVEYSKKAEKEIDKLDRNIRRFILSWINKNLVGCENPRQYGSALTGNHKNHWRYRIGNYRVIADIKDDKITIVIITVGHRKNAYDE